MLVTQPPSRDHNEEEEKKEMKTLESICASNLSLPPETFIFSLTNYRPALTQPTLVTYFFAAISSDDSLTFFNVRATAEPSKATTASVEIEKKISNIHAGVSCCASFSTISEPPVIVTGGRDGFLKLWDAADKVMRSQLKTR